MAGAVLLLIGAMGSAADAVLPSSRSRLVSALPLGGGLALRAVVSPSQAWLGVALLRGERP